MSAGSVSHFVQHVNLVFRGLLSVSIPDSDNHMQVEQARSCRRQLWSSWIL